MDGNRQSNLIYEMEGLATRVGDQEASGGGAKGGQARFADGTRQGNPISMRGLALARKNWIHASGGGGGAKGGQARSFARAAKFAPVPVLRITRSSI